jgi:hypothetical protein
MAPDRPVPGFNRKKGALSMPIVLGVAEMTRRNNPLNSTTICGVPSGSAAMSHLSPPKQWAYRKAHPAGRSPSSSPRRLLLQMGLLFSQLE